MKILTANDLVLVPTIEKEIPYLWDLLSQWKSGHLWKSMYISYDAFYKDIKMRLNCKDDAVWTVWTKQGKSSKKCGIILLSDIYYGLSADIHGVADKQILKRYLCNRAFRAVLDYCFNDLGCARVNAKFFEKDAILINFLKRHKFKKHAYLKKSVYVNEDIHDTYIYGLLEETYFKKEIQNVKPKKT